MNTNQLRQLIFEAATVAAAVAAPAAFAIPVAAAADQPAPLTVLYAEYPNDKAADQALKAIKAADKEGSIKVESYAVVRKDAEGKVSVKDQRRRKTVGGAVVGGLIGLLGGPVGVAVGAGVGGTAGHLMSAGMDRDTLRQIEASLQPGESAVIAVVQERWVADTRKALQAAQARQVLTDDLESAAPGAQPSEPSQPPQPSHETPPPPPQ
jgi:uncharacterized membrane protein